MSSVSIERTTGCGARANTFQMRVEVESLAYDRVLPSAHRQGATSMGDRLREIDAESKFSHTLSFDAFSQVLPLERLTAVLAAEHLQTPSERTLTLPITRIVTIALHL